MSNELVSELSNSRFSFLVGGLASLAIIEPSDLSTGTSELELSKLAALLIAF